MTGSSAGAPGHPLADRLGTWSALTGLITFITYTVCFIAILMSAPPFTWTGTADYVAYVDAYGGAFRILAQAAMLVFSLSLVVLLNAIHAVVPPGRRPLTRIGLSFGLLFTATVGAHYFTQLSAVRLNVLQGNTDGLRWVVQANPYSVLSAVNMLGWSIFLGLASLFVAPVFSGTRLERLIRLFWSLNGLFCLSGAVGYTLKITWLVFVTITLGMGGAVSVVMAGLTLWFRRRLLQRDRGEDPPSRKA